MTNNQLVRLREHVRHQISLSLSLKISTKITRVIITLLHRGYILFQFGYFNFKHTCNIKEGQMKDRRN